MAVTDFNHTIYFSKLVQNFILKCKCYLNFISVSITVENWNNFNTLPLENFKCSSVFGLVSSSSSLFKIQGKSYYYFKVIEVKVKKSAFYILKGSSVLIKFLFLMYDYFSKVSYGTIS